MTINIKKDAWNRNASFIKMIMENLQIKSSDEAIVNLFRDGMKDHYPDGIKLSENDIFLLYCKLIEAKKTDVVKQLRLIEDLVDFKEEYTYETTYRENQHDKTIKFPLLAYCVYNQVDWKDIAFIQQRKNISNATNMQIELQKEHWKEQLVKESLLDSHQGFQKYKPYIMMGDVYVNFINNKDNWDINIRDIYTKYPQQVNEYLDYMAGHFSLAIQSILTDESETVSKSDQDWLAAYAKTLRNMTEKVIDAIDAKRSLTKVQKHQARMEVSQTVLAHLDALDENSLKVLDEKIRTKLTDFIKALRKNVNKVSPVDAYENTQFFTPSSDKLDKSIQTEVSTFSPQIK